MSGGKRTEAEGQREEGMVKERCRGNAIYSASVHRNPKIVRSRASEHFKN